MHRASPHRQNPQTQSQGHPGLHRPPPHHRRPHRNHQRTTRTPPRHRPRIHQPPKLPPTLPPPLRRIPTPPTPSNAKSRFNPNRSGGPLPIEPTPLTLPCSRTTPIRWTPPNGANPHRRCKRASTMTDDASARHRQPHRRRASATDASGNNARDGTATNTFCPSTLFHGLDQSQRQLLSASHPSPSVTHRPAPSVRALRG